MDEAEYRELERKKNHCHYYTNRQLALGLIQRQPCEVCKTEKGIQSHHPDYNEPDRVKWYCQQHHSQEDKKEFQRTNQPNKGETIERVSEAEHQRRLQMYLDGRTDKEISIGSGVSREGIAKWRRRNTLFINPDQVGGHNVSTLSRTNVDEENRRMEMYNKGCVDREIAEGVCTKEAIHQWRKVRGLPANKKTFHSSPVA